MYELVTMEVDVNSQCDISESLSPSFNDLERQFSLPELV